MDKKIDTVREALDKAYDFKLLDPHTVTEIAYREWRDSFLVDFSTSLSAIDPDAIRAEALVEKVITFFNNRVTIGEAEDECGDLVSVLELGKDFRSDLAKMLSVVDPEAIRRECADKAVNWWLDSNTENTKSALRAAILSAEPAQDDGKPDVVMTMIENGDLTISWECSGCKKLIDDKEDIESMKKCPHCGAPISNFLYIEEARS